MIDNIWPRVGFAFHDLFHDCTNFFTSSYQNAVSLLILSVTGTGPQMRFTLTLRIMCVQYMGGGEGEGGGGYLEHC